MLGMDVVLYIRASLTVTVIIRELLQVDFAVHLNVKQLLME